MDPASVKVLSWYTTASWSWSKNLPASPALIGALLNMQVYELNGAALPATTSNGLSLFIGN